MDGFLNNPLGALRRGLAVSADRKVHMLVFEGVDIVKAVVSAIPGVSSDIVWEDSWDTDAAVGHDHIDVFARSLASTVDSGHFTFAVLPYGGVGELESKGHVWFQGAPDRMAFCEAKQNVYSWFFADDRSLARHLGDSEFRVFAEDLPLPENVPFPLFVLDKFARDVSPSVVLADMDVAYACARSPSLHRFATTLCGLLEVPIPEIAETYSRNLNRDVIANLVEEVAPPGMPVYRAADGSTYTAERMTREIREGSHLGRQYASDLLRVSRDMLSRQARRAAG